MRKALAAAAIVLLLFKTVILLGGAAGVVLLLVPATRAHITDYCLTALGNGLLEALGNRDTLMTSEDGRFSVADVAGRWVLMMYTDDGTSATLLDRVTSYYSSNGQWFLVSKNGCAVVNLDTKLCRIYDSKSAESYGRKLPQNFVEHESIQYLNSFFEFSEEEQETLKRLEN